MAISSLPSQLRHFAICSLAFVVLVPSILLGIISVLRCKYLDITVSGSENSLPNNQGKVQISAQAVAIDPIARTITMDWHPEFLAYTLNCSNDSNDPIINEIYVSPAIMDSSSPGWSAPPLYSPLFTYNSTQQCLGFDLSQPYASFRTITRIVSERSAKLSSMSSSLQGYPLDVYTAPFAIWIQDVTTGEIHAPDVTLSGIVVNFEVYLDDRYVSSDLLGNNRLLFYLNVRRSTAVRAFVFATVITNWLATTAFLIIVAAALTVRPHEIYSEMFVVPVGALFAFTSIRANLPGAPDGFGTTLDMYSILPVLFIMSTCSFVLLLIVLFRRISQIVYKKDSGVASRFWASKFEGEGHAYAASPTHKIRRRGSTLATLVSTEDPPEEVPSLKTETSSSHRTEKDELKI